MAGATFTRVKTWAAGETLTDSDLNGEFDNILSNLTPAGIDDESSSDAAMQSVTDPYPAAAISKATSLQGEIQRLRYLIKQVTGETYWYVDPDTTLAALSSSMGTAQTDIDNIESGATAIPMAALTPAVADHQASGPKCTLKAHENVAFGDVCYCNSDGEMQIADADAIATTGIFAIAIATILANASGLFALPGSFVCDETWNWTVGGYVYVTVTGTTGNTLSQSPPTGTDDAVQIVGVATHADRIFFNPQLLMYTHV